MPLTLITPPTAVPVSLDDAKLFLRVDGNAEDALITALAAGARENFVHLTYISARNRISGTSTKTVVPVPTLSLLTGRF